MNLNENPGAWFAQAADAFVDRVRTITEDEWSLPGLGEWDVRDLVGHTSRSFLTLESYRTDGVPAGAEWITSAANYYAQISKASIDPAQIAARGRAAAQALGDDPVGFVDELAARVVAWVGEAPASQPMMTIAGPMALAEYLPTRAFELTVHTLDLDRALGRKTSPELLATVGAASALAVEIAHAMGTGEPVLLALTGRGALPADYSVVI